MDWYRPGPAQNGAKYWKIKQSGLGDKSDGKVGDGHVQGVINKSVEGSAERT